MWHVWETGEILVGRPERRIPFRRPGHRWKKILELNYKKWDREARTGLICVRLGIGSDMCKARYRE